MNTQLDLNNFPITKRLKYEVAELLFADLMQIGIELSDEQLQRYQNNHAGDMINNVVDNVMAQSLPSQGAEQAAKGWVEDRFNGGVSPTTETHCVAAFLAGASFRQGEAVDDKFEFAEWVENNYLRWTNLNGRWYTYDEWPNRESLPGITTPDLYTLFLNSRKQDNNEIQKETSSN